MTVGHLARRYAMVPARWLGDPSYFGLFSYSTGEDHRHLLNLAYLCTFATLPAAVALLILRSPGKCVVVASALLVVMLHFFDGYPVY